MGLCSSGYAASFNCHKASTPVEKMICANSTLSGMDDYMNLIYSQLKTNRAFQNEQLSWLKQRNTCASDSCLIESYQSHLRDISKTKYAANISGNLSTFNGHWLDTNSKQTSGSTLTISKANTQQFNFLIRANAGGNTGEIEGQANVIGTLAFFSDDNNETLSDSPTASCTLMFELKNKKIKLISNKLCSNYGRNGVRFSGEYIKNTKSI